MNKYLNLDVNGAHLKKTAKGRDRSRLDRERETRGRTRKKSSVVDWRESGESVGPSTDERKKVAL